MRGKDREAHLFTANGPLNVWMDVREEGNRRICRRLMPRGRHLHALLDIDKVPKKSKHFITKVIRDDYILAKP
jgi:hypothetical protein